MQEKRVVRHEYGRYGNPTTLVLEKKLRSLCLFMFFDMFFLSSFLLCLVVEPLSFWKTEQCT